MQYYINGQEVTREEMKLQYYIEKYRFELILIFIKKFFKKHSSIINFIVSFILWLCFLIIGVLTIGSNETNAYNGDKLLNNMNLQECRVTQDEASHIKKGNGSMYAYDIACIRGRSFEVYAPNYKNIYVVQYIGYDKRIGNYVTIKHGTLYFIYGHTITDLKIGDRVDPKQKIGRTDISGYSQNYHLHLELWEGKENISFEYVVGNGIIKAEKSQEIREQRNWLHPREVNKEILEFIKPFEGFEAKAYWDIQHYSNGYGTKAKHQWEVITKQEAELRARIKIQEIKDRYTLHNHPLKINKAVVSFVYNIGSLTSKQKWLLNNYYYTALANDFKLYNGYYKRDKNGKKIGEKIVLAGLEKRRNAEGILIRNG